MNLSDEELIIRYKSGDGDAIGVLFDRYKGIILHKVSALYLAGGEKEDLIQEGMIGLFNAVRDYQPGKGAMFETFASMCINRNILTAITKANRKKNMPLNESLSLDAPVADDGDGSEEVLRLMDMVEADSKTDPEKAYIDKERFLAISEAATDVLSKLEKQVYSLVVKGLTNSQIAKIIGRSEKSVDNARQRIKEKIRKEVDNG